MGVPRITVVVLCFSLGASACTATQATLSTATNTVPPPQAQLQADALETLAPQPSLPDALSRTEEMASRTSTLTLRATLYVVALEGDYAQGQDTAFLTRDGAVLHQSSKEFLKAATLQGTAKLNDGRTLMFNGRREGRSRWKISPHDHAVGYSGCKLVPFRSVAVDRRIVPIGTQLIIEETRGMMLPDGKRHDGVWYAVDTGGRIKNHRIDLFVGAGKNALAAPIKHGIRHLHPLTVRLGEQTKGCPAA